MKSLKSKLTVLVLPLFLTSAASSALALALRPFWLGLPLSILLFCLTVLAFRIIANIIVLRPLFRMKRDIDEDSPISIFTRDEFSELAERMNRKIETLKVIQDRDGEEQINRLMEAENDKYLQNINEGLLFIDYGQIISRYYSRALGEIFDRREIGGQHLSDFLYPDRDEEREKRKTLEKYILGLFHNPALLDLKEEESHPLRNIWVSRDDGRRVLVDGTFRKVEENGDLIQLMIIFRDRTEEGILVKKLDESGMRSDFEVDTIIAILRAGPGPFQQFLKEADEILSRFRSSIPALEMSNNLESSIRDISSIKCSAVYFDFRAVEKLCHNLEDILSDFRKENFSRKEALDIIVDDIYLQFDSIRRLIERFGEFLSSDQGRIHEAGKNEQEHFFDTLRIMMARHSDELNKSIDMSISSDFENYEKIGEIKDPIIHLLRNAIDYGIEDPEDRRAAGKNERGIISLKIAKKSDGGARITVEDDGKGIDFDMIRKIAVEKGLIKKEETPGQANLLRTLFSSGFSSREAHSGLSGRGVGLAIVKEKVSLLGGKISVKTERLKGSRFSIDLPSGL